MGTWSTRLRVLEAPLSGSAKWLEFGGTSVVSEIMGGRANLVELVVAGPAGRIEGLSLRLYDPGSGPRPHVGAELGRDRHAPEVSAAAGPP